MKKTLKNKIDNLFNYSIQWLLSIVRVILVPLFIVLELISIIIHPIIWSWTLFQCEFLFNYYIRKKYFKLNNRELIRYNIILNAPSRQTNTLANNIYRWCTFKIFERNNYKYDPDKKGSWFN